MSSSSKSKSPTPPGTPGGSKLRALREQAGRSQLWVEAEADLGTGYLQRVESGRVAQPSRATVERVLDALDARYSERRDVLELFGYTVATPLPTPEDVAWARERCHHELHDVPFPAYMLDCLPRLLAWNRFVPYLLGGSSRSDLTPQAALARDPPPRSTPARGADTHRLPRAGMERGAGEAVRPTTPGDAVLQRLLGRSMLAPWFDPASPFSALVAEPEVFLPALVRAMRYEIERFRHEPWLAAELAELQARLPRFRHYWERAAAEPPPISAARILAPVRLNVPGAGLLQFRLVSEPLVRDARFRLIYYVPGDPATMLQCAAWATAAPPPAPSPVAAR